jgi:hypothetical protein
MSSFDLAPLLYGKTMAFGTKNLFFCGYIFFKFNLFQQIGRHIRNGLVAFS